MGDDLSEGHLTVQSIAHLRLDAGDPDRYITEHLTGGDDLYQADAFAFNIRSPNTEGQRCRIVVARSMLFEGAVFVDYLSEYSEPQFTPEFLGRIKTEYNHRLALLGLSEAQPGDL